MGSATIVPAATVLADVVAPATVVIGPAGVFVDLSRGHGGKKDLRDHVRSVRERLDAAGLRALPVTGVLDRPEGSVALAETDVRFGPAVLNRAITALASEADNAPPWVATVADPVSPSFSSSDDENSRVSASA